MLPQEVVDIVHDDIDAGIQRIPSLIRDLQEIRLGHYWKLKMNMITFWGI